MLSGPFRCFPILINFNDSNIPDRYLKKKRKHKKGNKLLLFGIKQALKKCTQFSYKQLVDSDKKYKYFPIYFKLCQQILIKRELPIKC